MGVGYHGAGVENFDLARDGAHEQAGPGDGVGEVAEFRGQGLLGFPPESVVGRQNEGGEALGAPVGRAAARVGFGEGVEAIRPTEGETALFLGDGPGEEEVEVARAEASQAAEGEVGAALGGGEAEDVDRVEAIHNGAAEGGMLAAGGEEMLVVSDEQAGPLAPAPGARRIVSAMEARPP